MAAEVKENVPVPDPSLITSARIREEVATLREIIEAQLIGRINAVDQRFNDMDRALVLHRAANDKMPQVIEEKVGHLKELHNEKFTSIQTQFIERDVRTEQTSRDSKVAVDAALQAAKEAVEKQNQSSALSIAKSEAATGKQIDGLAALIASSNKASDEKNTDLKDRVTRIESMGIGVSKAKDESRASMGTIIAVAGVLAAVVSIAVGMIVDRAHDERPAAASPAPAPQIIYVPAPQGALIPSTPAASGQR
jgi:cation transport regulator ChaB